MNKVLYAYSATKFITLYVLRVTLVSVCSSTAANSTSENELCIADRNIRIQNPPYDYHQAERRYLVF